MSDKPTLTTTAGAPIADNQNSLTAGPRGPLLMQDYQLLEKLAHQNRERIPERAVHAKGWGAYGTLTITGDISRYTRAKVSAAGRRRPPMLARFSTVAGEPARPTPSATCAASPSSSTPRKATGTSSATTRRCSSCATRYKFPDFIHTQKRHPRTNLRSPTAMWDFWSLSPESLHQVTILMSDRGLPIAPMRHMNGYGSHTYSPAERRRNERFWVKFHFKTHAGPQALDQRGGASRSSARRASATRRSSSGRSRRATSRKWTVQVQIMPEADAGQDAATTRST